MTPLSTFLRLALLAFLATLLPVSAEAAPPDRGALIEAGTAENIIQIEPNFDGTNVVIFGAIDRERVGGGSFDIAISIHGPNMTEVVWKKARVAGIWMNSRSLTFDAVPSFYAVLSTRPVAELAPVEDRKQYDLGLDVLTLQVQASDRHKIRADLDDFKSGLIRVKRRNHLFFEDNKAVEFVGKSLFRAKAFLPASAGPGLYRATIFLFSNGKVIGLTNSQIRLSKVGIEEFLAASSANSPLLYGFMAVLLAVLIGSGASFIFPRR